MLSFELGTQKSNSCSLLTRSVFLCRVNDPVAAKLLRRAGEMPSLAPPDDASIKTLYVGGLVDRVTEEDLKDQFYSYGELESIRMVPQRACAFVTYTTREGAEKAADHLANKLVINGLRLKLMWGRPQVAKADIDEKDEDGKSNPVLPHGGMLPRALISQQQQQQHEPGSNYFNLPPPSLSTDRPFYPSMDPQRMGAVMKQSEGSNLEQGEGSSNLEQRPPMGPPPYGYSPQGPHPGPHPHFQQQHFRGPPPYPQGPPPHSYQQYPPPQFQGGPPPPFFRQHY